MSEVCREGSYRVIVFPNDHTPPHVHVFKKKGRGEGCSVKLTIEEKPQEIQIYGDMTDKEVKKAKKIVAANLQDCLAKWEKFHGTQQDQN